jgi:hypothetical protein
MARLSNKVILRPPSYAAERMRHYLGREALIVGMPVLLQLPTAEGLRVHYFLTIDDEELPDPWPEEWLEQIDLGFD